MTLSLRSSLLTARGFRHGFSLRAGGTSSGPYASLNLGRGVGDEAACVLNNHRLFADDIGYAAECLYELTQVHGALAIDVDPSAPPERFREQAGDALVSTGENQAIAVRVADCTPVLLACPDSGLVAAVHAGWRGVVGDVVAVAVKRLCELGKGAPERLIAAVFPCIGPSAFEVGSDVAAQIAARVSEHCVISSLDQHGEAKPHVDLAHAVRVQLERAGLRAPNVEQVAGCTFSEPARFFSHRRDRGLTGRHLAAIVSRC